jgi:hypothetical protein
LKFDDERKLVPESENPPISSLGKYYKCKLLSPKNNRPGGDK